MDQQDQAILRALQSDSDRSIAELAAEIGLSASACHRRIKLLEANGLILGYVAKVDPKALGLAVEAIVEITLATQSQEALDAFEAAVRKYDQILECNLTTGQADYLLRIVARDVVDYDDIHRNCLARLPNVASMQTAFKLRSIKTWRGYPVR